MIYHKNIKLWFIVLGVVAIASVFLVVYFLQSRSKNKLAGISETSIDQTEVFNQSSGSGLSTVKTQEEEVRQLPGSFLLSVPFQSQAPFGDWSQPYQDGCEEAAIIIVEHYLDSSSLSKDQMKSEIDDAVAWQMANWGTHADLDADQTLTLAQNYFKLSGQVVRNYQLEDLKKYISSGLPIIAPTAGRQLGNPNFRGAGPEYHNIVIIGYDDSQGIFITNDPGTRNGKSYVYKYQTVLDAVSGPKEDLEKAVVLLNK